MPDFAGRKVKTGTEANIASSSTVPVISSFLRISINAKSNPGFIEIWAAGPGASIALYLTRMVSFGISPNISGAYIASTRVGGS